MSPQAAKAGCGSKLTLVVAGLLLGGCFRQVREEAQLPETSFLKLPDLPAGTDVQVSGDRSYRFVVRQPRSARYTVRPGTYRVTATRGGWTILDRKVFVAEGETQVLRSR